MINAYLQPAVRVELADVAGPEPAVLGERGGGRLGILEVAVEDRVAADEDLAVGVESHVAALDGVADRAEAVIVGIVDAQRARCLGEPVALDHEHVQRVEELEDLDTQRRCARDAQAQAAPEALAHLREDELVRKLDL